MTESHSINVKPRPRRIRRSPLRRETDALLAILTGHEFTDKEHAFISLTPTFCPRFMCSALGQSSVRDTLENLHLCDPIQYSEPEGIRGGRPDIGWSA